MPVNFIFFCLFKKRIVSVYAFGASVLVIATHVVWLLGLAMEICKDSITGMEIEYVDISPLPFLNTDLEVDGTYPPVVEAFRKKIEEADCFLFASPEYNYSITGVQLFFFFLPFFHISLIDAP